MLWKQVCMKYLWKNLDYFVYLIKFYLDKNCFRCKNKVFVEEKENENVDIEHENENEVMKTDEIWHETANDIVNQSLEMFECSPLKVLTILSIGKTKIKDVTTKF